MMRGSHARDDNSFSRSASMQTLKGAALLFAAVLIGIILLHTAPHPRTVTGGLSPITTKAPRATPTSAPSVASPPTTAAPRSPSAVHVLVANGAGVVNLGAKIRGQLNAAGYNTDKPAIDAPTSDHAVSSIYFQPGFEAEALQLATVLSLAPSVVQPLPTAAPPVPADKLIGADVLVIAGQDIAGVQTTSAPGPTVAQTPRTTIHHSPTTVPSHTTTTAGHTSTTAAHTTTTIK